MMQPDQQSKSPQKSEKETSNKPSDMQLDEYTLELAKQVLLESREVKLDEDGYDPMDPYAQQAKLIDQKEKASKELKEREKKAQKLRDMQRQKFQESQFSSNDDEKGEFKKVFRVIKLSVCAAVALYSIFQALAKNEGDLIDRNLVSEFFGMKNLIATLKESWFLILIVFMYYFARKYNDKLDKEEMEYLQQQKREQSGELDEIQEQAEDQEEDDTNDEDGAQSMNKDSNTNEDELDNRQQVKGDHIGMNTKKNQ
ncbi:UNKNOWN [Stylonychia lemnae]|uniref:Transmembrane protein n=1 Tax=Stylonychia lemnae TaxID=5949 RepID=A0A078A594_STYLE|nr:UNKNOWN [Stylonychia lemnae]|eukprot:CDW77395.1 UNKNOWN [Stylonychia lemnae]